VTSPISGLVTRLLVAPASRWPPARPWPWWILGLRRGHQRLRQGGRHGAHDPPARRRRQGPGPAQWHLRREAQQAETDAANAAADRDAALQALQALKLDPKAIKAIQAGQPISHIEGVIRAPIAGTVVEKLITPGQLLQAGTTPAFTVANLSKVWVMAQIASSDVASVKAGDPADIETGVGFRAS